MKIEIWSDIMCPFCYIGKKRFENALDKFTHRDEVTVEWKSFQLNPDLQTGAYATIADYLAAIKGISREQAAGMNQQVAQMAAAEGLDISPEKSIPANSFNAHRLIQFAKTKSRGAELAQILFRFYFAEGRNIDDNPTLLEAAAAADLDTREAATLFDGSSDAFSDLVEQDIYQARQIGVRGVPYFVFGDKYAVSGAQSEETFLGALQRTWEERG